MAAIPIYLYKLPGRIASLQQFVGGCDPAAPAAAVATPYVKGEIDTSRSRFFLSSGAAVAMPTILAL